jgi:protein involved in ribonucleotide reduction
MAAGKYFLQQSSWPYNTEDKLVTYRLFHMHGDAFLNLFSEVPQNLTVSHASVVLSGVNTFNVTANSGSFIAITQDTNVLGTGTGTGSSLAISIPGTQVPGQFLKVVITKQNYYRYESSVQVIPPSGPYVIKDSVAINDLSPFGNGNGLMDYGETNKLALRVKNVGSVTATGVSVKVTESDPYVTMTDSTETYGDIGSNATMNKVDAFAYTVANNIPDGHTVDFTVTATSGSTNWGSTFSITAHSPALKMGTYSIVDSTGNNNGRFDPGENVKFNIPVKNTGSSNATGVSAKLFALTTGITLTGDSIVYGNINFNDSIRKQFNVSAAPTVPLGTSAKFVLKSYAAGGAITKIDSFSVVVGQNWAIIGNGTVQMGSASGPYNTYWYGNRTQMLWTAAELNNAGGGAGAITKIGFDIASVGGQAMNGMNVRMQTTSSNTLSGFTSTGWTTAYTGTYTVPGTGWQYIELQTPFIWNGTSNLLVEICFGNTSYTTATVVNGTTISGMEYTEYHDLSTACSYTGFTAPTLQTARANACFIFDFVTGINQNNGNIPKVYSLSQNYPNPFNPVTKINFALPKQGFVSLKIYDVLGREVRTLVNEVKSAGQFSVDFNASEFASGVYFYRLESNGFSDIKRMMLIK